MSVYTFDSTNPFISVEVAKKIGSLYVKCGKKPDTFKYILWCNDLDDCMKLADVESQKSASTLFIDTPISLTDDITKEYSYFAYTLKKLSFLFLDELNDDDFYKTPPKTKDDFSDGFERVINNMKALMKNRDDLVLITNSKKRKEADYYIYPSNCDIDNVAGMLATIVYFHIQKVQFLMSQTKIPSVATNDEPETKKKKQQPVERQLGHITLNQTLRLLGGEDLSKVAQETVNSFPVFFCCYRFYKELNHFPMDEDCRGVLITPKKDRRKEEREGRDG